MNKLKKWAAFAMAAVLAGSTAPSALAATVSTRTGLLNPPAVTEETSSAKLSKERRRPQLSDEEKAQREARRKTAKEKLDAQKANWDALSNTDKETIYELQRQKLQLEIEEVNQYQALGLIDADQAAKRVERINERISNVGSSSSFGRPRGGKDEKKVPKSASTATSLS